MGIAGTPSAEMKDRFTRVLQGHIALATLVFPEGTTGAQIDAFARRALWAGGLDYDHGTGHVLAEPLERAREPIQPVLGGDDDEPAASGFNVEARDDGTVIRNLGSSIAF